MQNLIERFGKVQFAQMHRSYALNLKLVTNVDLLDYTVHLGVYTVLLSKRNEDAFLKRLEVL